MSQVASSSRSTGSSTSAPPPSSGKGKGKAPAAPKPKVKAGSNWAALKPKVTDPNASKKRKRPAGEVAGSKLSFEDGEAEENGVSFQRYVCFLSRLL